MSISIKKSIFIGLYLTALLLSNSSIIAEPIVPRQASKAATPPSIETIASLDSPPGPSLQPQAPPPLHKQELVGKGDTLATVLGRAGVPANQAADAFASVGKIFNPKDLRPGQQVWLDFAADPETKGPTLEKILLKVSVEREIVVTRQQEGGYRAQAILTPLMTKISRVAGTIDTSLFVSGTNAGIPADVMMDMIRILSFDVDFQRDIQAGDGFEAIFEQKVTQEGKLARNDRLLYAAMKLSGVELRLFRFENSEGFVDFYTPKGESVRKALLKTPIDGAKLTSGFGMRQHPILGFSLMHKGIDFGAPPGTPIQAAGDGILRVYGFNGAYGNYAQIQHNGQYSTAYAHMSRFAPGLRVNSRVRQGQILGYVGSTGRSTGPHLHYEVLVGGTQINPLSVKLPAGRKLEGADLHQFLAQIQALEEKMEHLPQPVQIARAR